MLNTGDGDDIPIPNKSVFVQFASSNNAGSGSSASTFSWPKHTLTGTTNVNFLATPAPTTAAATTVAKTTTTTKPTTRTTTAVATNVLTPMVLLSLNYLFHYSLTLYIDF